MNTYYMSDKEHSWEEDPTEPNSSDDIVFLVKCKVCGVCATYDVSDHEYYSYDAHLDLKCKDRLLSDILL